jgi:hypothetical protein
VGKDYAASDRAAGRAQDRERIELAPAPAMTPCHGAAANAEDMA